jgi:hypothetical protein
MLPFGRLLLAFCLPPVAVGGACLGAIVMGRGQGIKALQSRKAPPGDMSLTSSNRELTDSPPVPQVGP